MKKIKILYLIALFPMLILGSCEKDGTAIMPVIKSVNKQFNISGFVLGDTVEQYFDGLKMREYYGQVRTTGFLAELAFVKDEINMELKKKSNGEVIYKQTFHVNDKQNIVPKFYFDGTKVATQYPYPVPQGNDYTVNFFIEKSTGAEPIDINVEVLEYYYDDTKQDPLVVVKTTTHPIAQNVKPGSWTPYFKIPIPTATATQSGTELYPIVVMRDSKTKQYFVNNNRDESTLMIELPYDGVSPGKVQSLHISRNLRYDNKFYYEMFDLTKIFPR